MDIELIKQTSRTKYLHSLAKETAKEKYLARLTIPHEGGLFKITLELITFLKSQTKKEYLILLDSYENPIKVNRKLMIDICEQTYHEVMKEWFDEHQEINKQR